MPADQNPGYESVGNTLTSGRENRLTEGIPQPGMSFREDAGFSGKLKVPWPPAQESRLDASRYSHIASRWPGLKIITGEQDNRAPVDSTVYPYRSICLLLIRSRAGGEYFGTGFLISERCVITAGHCVYFEEEWAREIEVIPGAYGTCKPFGSARSVNFRSVKGWTRDGDKNYDHGAVLLDNDHLFRKGGSFFGYRPFNGESGVEVSGYPLDKEGTQWKDAGRVHSFSAYRIYYELDTVAGNSGSPVFADGEEQKTVVGVHTLGCLPNSSTRVNGDITARWNEWSEL